MSRFPFKVICINAPWQLPDLTLWKTYEVVGEIGRKWLLSFEKGRRISYSKKRFIVLEETEMKTPPEPCKCKQTAPVQQPRPENNLQDYNAAGDGLLLTRTDWRIARNTLAKLEQQLRCGVAKSDETYEIVRTVTHILKG